MVAIDVYVKSLSKYPDEVSGDAFWYAELGAALWMLVVDGLGSGEAAATASRVAVDSISSDIGLLGKNGVPMVGGETDVERFMIAALERADERMRRTRGAAVGLACLDLARCSGLYAGIGNVELRVVGPASYAHPISMPGIVGAGLRRVRVEHFAYAPDSLLLMHSDGLSSRFDTEGFEDIRRNLHELGDALVTSHRNRDDLTLLMVRHHA